MKNWTLRFRAEDKDNFEELRSGLKSIETRAATVKYKNIKVGDTLTFTCDGDHFTKTITKRYHWPSVDKMVREVPFKRVMPNVQSISEMKAMYDSYPDYTEKIALYGLFGWGLK